MNTPFVETLLVLADKFCGLFCDPLPWGKSGCRVGIFSLFWGMWGFLLCSWIMGYHLQCP